MPYSYSSFPGVIIEFPSGKLPSSSTGSTLCPISSNFGLDVAPLDGPGGRGSDGCHHCPHCVEHCRGEQWWGSSSNPLSHFSLVRTPQQSRHLTKSWSWCLPPHLLTILNQTTKLKQLKQLDNRENSPWEKQPPASTLKHNCKISLSSWSIEVFILCCQPQPV